jgi:NADPH2:quinone reductase
MGAPPALRALNPPEVFGKSLKVSGFAVTMMYALANHHRRALEDVFRLEREGKLSVPIGGRFPLAEAAQAHRFLESRRSTGKLLLIP